MNKTKDEILSRVQQANEVIGAEAVSKLKAAGFLIMDAADVNDLWQQYKALAMTKTDVSLAMLDIYTMRLEQEPLSVN